MSKGFLLNIHLNYLDKKAYSGWDGKLPDTVVTSDSKTLMQIPSK